MRNRWWAAPGVAAAVALLAACGSSASGGNSAGNSPNSPAASSSASPSSGVNPGGTAQMTASGIKTTSVSGGKVLTNAAGFTLYWFAKDTTGKSNCNGACATYWPPVIGKPSSTASLPGTWGTIKRADGQLQATYDGHPLYLYKGDTSAGQVHGNDVNASGGLWWAMTPSGAKLTAAHPAPSKSSKKKSSGGAGYGY
jgi:predicted lipoprotein with Yx(FWY)xxD motif